MPDTDLSERRKYEWLHANRPGYGATNHGAGAEELCRGYDSLLDVGAGFATFAADVLSAGIVKEASAVDISVAPMIEQEKRGVKCFRASALEMRLGKFDVVTAFDVLEHFPLEERADSINNIYRHARRRLIFSIGFHRGTQFIEGEEVTVHHTVQSADWWCEYLIPFGGTLWTTNLPSVINTGERRNTTFFVVDKRC